MESGKLRELVTITGPVITKSAHNQDKINYGSLGQLRASINPISGKEINSADAIESQLTHRIRVRKEFLIKPKNRVEHEDRVFNIVFVREIGERNHEYALLCIEVFN